MSDAQNEFVERIEAVCPSCRSILRVRRAYIGNDVCCKHCDQVFRVREPAESDVRSELDVDGLSVQPSSLQADHERLRVAHDLLQAEHGRLRAECDEARDGLGRATTELAMIRAALGTIAPEEVERLVSERHALAAEVHRLRDEIHALAAAQSAQEQVVADCQQRALEMEALRARVAELTRQLDRSESVNRRTAQMLGEMGIQC